MDMTLKTPLWQGGSIVATGLNWYNTVFALDFGSCMMDWPARLRPWLNALLVLLLMLPLARLTWRLGVPTEAPPPTVPVAVVARNAPPPRLDVSRVRQAMLFGQANSVGPNGELPESTLGIKLQGVIAAGESPAAVAIFDSGDAQLRAVRVGMAVQPNVVIKAVYKDRVVVSNNGRDERISLQAPPPISLNSPPSVSGPTAGSGFNPGSSARGYVNQAAPGYASGVPNMQPQGGPPPGYPGFNGPPNGNIGMPQVPPSWQTQ